MKRWHQLDIEQALKILETNAQEGLNDHQAQERLKEYGPNELEEKGVKTLWAILWEQLTDVMVIVLIVAAVISGFIGEMQDTIVILAIVVLNALLGLSQEYRAEQAMAALKQMAVPTVRVKRNGRSQEISARQLVPGDIVLLEAGNLIPADGRLVEVVNLRIEESALTGESEPVDKENHPIAEEDAALGDRKNMVFMGTTVVSGRGAVVITDTGMKTQLGNIADLLQSVERDPTPLQRRLDGLGKTLAWLALVIIIVVFLLGLFTNPEVHELANEGATLLDYLQSDVVQELFLIGISMAVAAVPEGLPAVVTIALALGSQRMLKRNSLIRKLPAVETLGSVTIICSDKTGTLTQNKMTVTVLDVAGEQREIEAIINANIDLDHIEEKVAQKEIIDPPARSLGLLVKAAALCNDAELEEDENGGMALLGDPTETALVVAARELGLHKRELDARWPRVAEVPFSSSRKMMTTIHKAQVAFDDSEAPWRHAPYVAFTKGAVDNLLDYIGSVWMGDKATPITDELRERIEKANANLAQKGQRVLGVAFRPLESLPDPKKTSTVEQALTFIGLTAMIDPPRPEVATAVAQCRAAGIRPVMITGDHPLTAHYIASEIDVTRNEHVYTGQQLAKIDQTKLKSVVENVSVFARVAPEHKLNIVDAFQDKGEIVAMTGDGVNDAPALQKADIGVAMGITGTDVSKEAADMVLLDDNFATIVEAVEEGRTIYDNIRKFIKYTLSSNTGELLVMLIAPFLGMPLPLIPIQILWINLVTDGLPGLALSVEEAERGTMERPPHHPQESIFSRGLGAQILWVGLLMGIVSLGVGYWGFLAGKETAVWRTMTFTTLTLAQMGNALAIRSNTESLFKIGFFSNRIMVGAVSLTFALQIGLIYVPFLQEIFDTTALTAVELIITLISSLTVFIAIELYKAMLKK